ncbi:glucosamine kinase [Ochrobactrum daejeonense]|uniref:Glucosamine kinase n=1 Tax=Brucella daejeonensis TaxID=659015 RepID=A0A7W9EPQ9_9HYPH|nr:BadF/BadG/BcrA/BcrD ATPase family protein [Brucella daejeonensis]MBB5704056.1 glucosamine kinase [Brucella daejeonensis]
MPYIIAVDGGGTGCRALLADGAGTIIGRGLSGPANIGADRATALENIAQAATRAAGEAGLDVSQLRRSRAVLGLAGANSLADRDSLHHHLPFGPTEIVSDAVTALQGALGNENGAIVILGTGSVFVRREHEAFEIVGGRGFMLSDHAGGARLGREVLEETLLALDGMAGHTKLVEAVMAGFGGDTRRIVAFSRTATAADYAAFAPLVFDHAQKGDALGIAVLQRACAHVARGLDRLGVEKLGRFSLAGGLAASYAALPFLPHQALYRPALGDALTGALSLALAANGPDESRTAKRLVATRFTS